jgi:hypothetical protein
MVGFGILCVTVVGLYVVEGFVFFIDGNAILDGPEFARGGDILGGRETGENLGPVCL